MSLAKKATKGLMALLIALFFALGLAFVVSGEGHTASADDTASSGTEINEKLNSVGEGGTVKLAEGGSYESNLELTVSQNVTLDLNGQTIKGSITVQGEGSLTIVGDVAGSKIVGPNNAYVIDNNGTLTLKGADLVVENPEEGKTDKTTSLVRNNGTLTIEGGTYTSYTTAADAAGVENNHFNAVKNESAAKKLTINGGTFNGVVQAFGTTEITGGTFPCTVCGGGAGEEVNPGANTNGKLTISGGTFGAVVTSYVEVDISGEETAFNGQVHLFNKGTISGGKFDDPTNGIALIIDANKGSTGNITITGGEFKEQVQSLASATTTIDGGTFNDIVSVKADSTCTITNGTFNDIVSVKADSTCTITNGTFNDIIYSYGTMTVEGGTFNDSILARRDNGATGTVTVSGGTFTNKQYVAVEAYTGSDSDGYVSGAVTIEPGDNLKFAKDKMPDQRYLSGGETGKQTVTNADGSVSYVSEDDLVADIGGTKYSKVAAAIANATDGQTVKLTKATTEDVVVPAKVQNVTLDLDGKTLTGVADTANATITIEQGASLTIQNGTVKGSGNYYVIENHGTLELSGLTVEHTTENATSSLVANKTGATLTIKSGTYTTDFIAVKNESTSNLTIENGTFTANSKDSDSHLGQAVQNWGTATLSNGTYNGVVSTLKTESEIESAEAGGDTTITGGTYTKVGGYIGTNENIALENPVHNSKITITGGTYTSAPFGVYLKEGYGVQYSGTGVYSIAHAYEASLDEFVNLFGLGNTVTFKFDTLESAVAYVKHENTTVWTVYPSNFTIVLQSDRTTPFVYENTESNANNYTLNLDLNGHSVSSDSDNTITVKSGKLTFVGKGTVDNKAAGKAALEIENGATVVIGNAAAGIALMALDPEKLSFTHSENVGPTIENAGALTINEAQVLAKDTDTSATHEQPIIVNKSNGSLTIENVELGTAPAGAEKTSKQQLIQNWGNATLNGGNYNGQVIQCSETGSSSNKLDIKGGNYAGEVYAATGSAEGGNVSKVAPEQAAESGLKIEAEEGKEITFTSSEVVPEKEYFAPNSVPEINDDGEYTVGSKNDMVAKIVYGDMGEHEEYFETLQKAIDFAVEYAAVDGGALTITLTNNVNNENVTVEQAHIILDLAGHTWTGANGGIVLTVDNERANLTIKSSAAGGKITGDSTHYVIQVKKGTVTLGEKGGDDTYLTVENTGDGPASTIDNFGTLTIESGTYNHHDKPEEGVTKSCNAVKNEGGDATLTINGGTFDGVVLAYGNATINGGTFKQTVSGGNNLPNPEGVNTNGKLTIKGGTFETMVQSFVEVDISGEPEFKKQMHLYNKGTITGGKFGTEDANGVSLVIESGVTDGVTIEGGTFSHQIQTSSELTVKGGTFTEDVVAMRNNDNTGSVTVTGGTFEGDKTVRAYTGTDDPYVAGAVSIEPAKGGEGVKFTNSHATLPDLKYFPDPKDIPVSTGSGYTSGGTMAAVAYIGGVGYASLNDAVAAVTDRQTIVLVDDLVGDFTISRSFVFTLDLNGHTITGTDDSENATLTIEGNTNLTIISSVTGGKITGSSKYYVILNNATLTLGAKGGNDEYLTVTNEGSGPASTIDNHSILTIESGTYNHNVAYQLNQENECNAVKNESEATLTINGGKFSNAVLAYGNATINAGTFEQPVNGGNHLPNPVGGNTSGKLTIKGGEFKSLVVSYEEVEISGTPTFERQVQLYNKGTISGGTFAQQSDDTPALVVDKNDETEGTEAVTIKGGEFNGTVYGHDEVNIESGKFNAHVSLYGNAKISGGEFNAVVSASPDKDGAPGGLTITNGTFNSQVHSYCDVTIEGGEFADGVLARRDKDSNCSITVKGGTFESVVGAYNGKVEVIEGAVTIDPDTENGKSVTFKEGATLPDASYFADPADYPVAKEGGGYVSGDADHKVVAYIGNVGYDDLQEALNAADGKTVVLAGDATGPVTVTGTNVTLDLNGHNLTGDGSAIVLTVDTSASLTIVGESGKIEGKGGNYVVLNNGTLTFGNEDGTKGGFTVDSAVGSGSSSTIDNQGTLTINGGTYNNQNSPLLAAIKNEPDKTLTIKGGVFDGQVEGYGNVIVENGTFNAPIFSEYYTDTAKGTLTIKDGEFNANVYSFNELNIEGGTFHADVRVRKDFGNDAPKASITGGTFEGKITGSKDGDEFYDGLITIDPDTDNGKTVTFTNAENLPNAAYFAEEKDIPVYDGNNYVSGGQSPVAMVGSVGYTSLQEAINAANGKTVTLLDAYKGNLVVSGGNNVTLDLNGYTITGTGEASTILVEQNASLTILSDKEATITGMGGHYVIENHGNLTLGAADGHAEFTINSEANEGKSSSTIANKETDGVVPGITIYGGTYQNNNAPKLAAIKNEPNTTIIIYNGTFEGQLQLFGTATINDGTFNDIVFSDYQVVDGVPTAGNLIVRKGTFTANVYAFGDLTITNGTFEKDVLAFTDNGLGDTSTPHLNITGGEFQGNVDVMNYSGERVPQDVSGALTLSGGTISKTAYGKLTSKDLDLEKVVVLDDGKYVIRDKAGATGILFGRSATEFKADTLYQTPAKDNDSRVCYRTDNGAGDWLVVTFTEFKTVATENIQAFYNTLTAGQQYSEDKGIVELTAIRDEAVEHIGEINYVDGVQGVQQINTHLETAKANMNAVLNQEQEQQLKTAIDDEVGKFATYASALNTNFQEGHDIYDAQVTAIKGAKSQAELAVLVAAAQNAMTAFNNSVEAAVREFQLYAASQGLDLEVTNKDLDDTCSTNIRAAENYHDIDTKLSAARKAVDDKVKEDYKQSVTNRKGSAKTELKTFAESLGFTIDDKTTTNNIDAYNKGITAIDSADNTTLEQVNAALATAKESITKFYNAIENAVVLVTNYAVSNGIDVSEISAKIAAIRAAKVEGTDKDTPDSILKAIADAQAEVDELVKKNVGDALNARKKTAKEAINALGEGRDDLDTKLNDTDKKSISELRTEATTETTGKIDKAESIDEVNEVVEEYTAKINLLIAKLDAIKNLTEFKTGRFTADPKVYTDRVGQIEGATSVEQVNEYRGLALAELTDFHNALLAAEARVRSYATGKGLDLTKDTRGDQIKAELWKATKSDDIETHVTTAKGLVDTWFGEELTAQKANAVTNFKAWAAQLNTHFDDDHDLIKNQVTAINGATDLTDLASRLSNAQNAVQNLYNAMKNAEEAVRLYAFINGINPDDEEGHKGDIDGFIVEIYQCADEKAVSDKIEEIRGKINDFVTGDEKDAVNAAKLLVKDYLEDYVKDTYKPDGETTYLKDSKVTDLINNAVKNIGGNADIDTRAELEAAMLDVVNQIDVRIAIMKADAELAERATTYGITTTVNDSLYDTYKKAVDAATTLEAVEVARAAALVAIENFHDAIMRNVEDFEAYATSQGFSDYDSVNAPEQAETYKVYYEKQLHAAKDYHALDAALRAAKAAIDTHVASADLAKAIENRQKTAKAELKELAESLGFTIDDGAGYTNNIEPYNQGIASIDGATGSLEAVNEALATAKAAVTALHNAIEDAVRDYGYYATSKGIDYLHSFPDHTDCQKTYTDLIRNTKKLDDVATNLQKAKDDVDEHVRLDAAAALQNRKDSAKAEVAAMGTKYNDDDVITGARNTANDAITVAGNIEAVNAAVETARQAIDLQVAKLDACAALDTYVAEHFLETATPDVLEGHKTTIKAKENIDEVNNAYATALSELTTFYNALVDAEALARSYVMTNGFDLGANVPDKEPKQTWDAFVKETIWSATKTADVEGKVTAVQNQVNTAVEGVLKSAVSEVQGSFKTWAENLNSNFTTGHKTFDAQNKYIGEAKSLDELATRLSNAQNAMQNLYNAMKNAAEAVRLYAFLSGIDPDGAHSAKINELITDLYTAADETELNNVKLKTAKEEIDKLVVADEAAAVATAKKNIETYLTQYVTNTYGTSYGGVTFLSDGEVSSLISNAVTTIGGDGAITTRAALEKALLEVVAKIDTRIAQIKAVEQLKLHADGYHFAAGTESIEAYTNGVTSINGAKASVEAVNEALATAMANVTAFYNKIEDAVNQFHVYAVSQGIDLTKAPHDACDTTYSGNIRKAKTDKEVEDQLTAAKKHVDDHVKAALDTAITNRKTSAKAELKQHAESLGFTINDETGRENNIEAYNTGISSIEGASTIDDINTALATAKANVTTFYNQVEAAVSEFKLYAIQKGVDFTNPKPGHEDCEKNLAAQLRGSKDKDELDKNLVAVKKHVDAHVKDNEEQAVKNRRTSALAEVTKMGEGYDVNKTINGDSITSLRAAATKSINDITDEVIKANPSKALDDINKIVEEARGKIELLCAKFDAIGEVDTYAQGLGFKATAKIQAWIDGTKNIDGAKDIQSVTQQRELALLAIAAFKSDLDNAEVTATAYATSHGIDLTTNVPGIVSETTWTKWIHDTLWTATNSEGITTKLNEVRSKINSAASDALQAAINDKIDEFKAWAEKLDNHFTGTHKLVLAQIEVLRHAASIDAIPALYDQVQSTVTAVKAAMESAISEIKTYALRNGVDINDEAHKYHINDAIDGIYSAADEATIRSYVDQIKQHIDDHVASDLAAALVAMKGKAGEMLKDAVPDEYESDDKITKLIEAGVTALNDKDIDSIEKFNAELDNQLALLAVRVAQLDAIKELETHATSYGMSVEIEAVVNGSQAIEAATTIPDVEMQLRGALLAVTEFNGKLTTAVAGVRTYAVLNGVDPDDSRIDYDAIKNAKNEDGITTAVNAAKKVIDDIRDADLTAALNKRKGTAKEELKAFAEPRTGLEVDAYTLGVAAIDAAGDISGVNTALEEARDDVEEYYNLYLDALLGLRTHAASHGHDLGDGEHQDTLAAVTDLLKEAKNAKDLEEKAKEAKTLLDDHIKKHDDENALAAYIESKVNELRFYAIEKGVKLSDDIVKSAIEAMQAVKVTEDLDLANAKARIDSLLYTAKENIDKQSAAEDTAAGKKAVVDALKLYAAAKDVEFTADMENLILTQGTVAEAELMAAQIKAQIDEIAALATAKAEALEDLGIYAAAKDVAWDDAWDTQIGSATTVDEVDAAGEKIGAEIDAIAVFNTAKAQALEDLRIYAATVGVAWDSEWADTLNDATDNYTLEVAVAEVRDAIDALADLASVKAETLKELRLYAAMKGVAWNEVWTETIDACAFASTIEEAAGKIYAEIDNIATLASYIQSKVEELRLYALEKGISVSDKAVTDAVGAMQNVKLGGTYNTLELAQAAVDEAFNAAKTAIDTAAGNNSLTSYKQATIEDLKLYAAMKGVAFTADMEATITAQTTAEAVAAEAQKIRTQIDSAATLASAKAQAETRLRTYAEMMGVAWKNEWTTAIAGAANTDAVTAQITAIRGEISAAAALASAKAQAIQELRIYAAGVGIMPDDAIVAEEEAKINAAETVAAVGTALASAKETIKRHAATEGTSAKYLVVFVANGNVVSVQNVTKGGSATKPADPEVYGKVFKGWVGTFTNVTSDLVITAEFDEAPIITEAKDDITDWLNEYLDNILNGVSDENVTAAVRTAAVNGDALTEKLNKVYSEANAKLVKGYYDEAIYYIENAENDNDVEYAVISFRNNVSAVEILEELVKRPVAEESSSAVEVAALVIGIIALVCAAAAVTAFLVFRKKKETAGAEGVEETPDSPESDE